MENDHDYDAEIQAILDKTMPLIARYIAAASAVCTLLMAFDVINGFRLKKLWFPSHFFSLNAASLTVLAVATKLPTDVNTFMIDSSADALAQYMGIIFMVTTLTNSMTSLGWMSNEEILSNVTALVIFVLTVAGNVVIMIIRFHKIFGDIFLTPILVPTIFMLLSLAVIVSLAIAIPSIKRHLEVNYQKRHRVSLREENAWGRREGVRIDYMRSHMMKYLVMVETSNPQFVMGRSAVCSLTASALFATNIFVTTILIKFPPTDMRGPSVYGNFTGWIAYIQCIGVFIGSIAPTFRLFVALRFKCSTGNLFKTNLRMEDYWTKILLEGRDSFSSLQIRENKFRKYLHNLKGLIFCFIIALQIFIVLLSKLLLLLFSILMAPFFWFIKKYVGEEFEDDEETRNLNPYVLRLEGEAELPKSVLQNIRRLGDGLIQKGRNTQPRDLLDLLRGSTTFDGVLQFDSDQIQSLHSGEEPPNCWSLSVVTLTSIAIALPNIDIHRLKQLLRSVSQGISLSKVVEKSLLNDDEQEGTPKATNICWPGVILNMQWFDIKLSELYNDGETLNDVLQRLSEIATRSVAEFVQDPALLENSAEWPARVLAANSMYRISRTLLLFSIEQQQTSEQLFERLSVMISDILAACFTNLPYLIIKECHTTSIEKREERVREAFLLLGKTEEIVQLLQQREWPPLDLDRAAHIDQWRDQLRQNI
ncbi:hypothetical protein ACS0TY_035873 [Phlomoides rotata]